MSNPQGPAELAPRARPALTRSNSSVHVVRSPAPPRKRGVGFVHSRREPSPGEWSPLLRALGVDAVGVARDVVPRSLATFSAGAVDVATGKVVLAFGDLRIGSASPFVFERTWSSASAYRGPLGHGWHHAFDIAIACNTSFVAARLGDGRVVCLEAPNHGQWVQHSTEHLRVALDAFGYVLRDAAGAELRFIPHRAQSAHVLASLRPRSGGELHFGYDQRARLTHIARRGGLEFDLAYDSSDRLVAITGPDARRAKKRIALAEYAYDARGNLRKASDALGQARRYAYEHGLLQRATDRNGCSLNFAWDGSDTRARCTRHWVGEAHRERRFEYAPGQTRVTNGRGQVTQYAHDGAVATRISNGCGVRELVRDCARRVVRDVNALGQVWRGDIDGAGRLLRSHGPGEAVWTFARDEEGRHVRVLDPIQGLWDLRCDTRGRSLCVTDPCGQTVRLSYRGRWLASITEPGERQTNFTYDAAGHLSSCTGPDGAVTHYAYDAWGQVVSVTDSRGLVQYRQYDALGRLVEVREPDGNTCELAYDAEGELVRFRDQRGEISFTYQVSGQLSSRTQAGLTVCFDYDADDALVGIVSETGSATNLQRTAAGEIAEVKGQGECVRSYTRDSAGRVARVERAGAFSEYDYDAADRVAEVQHSDGGFEGYRYRGDGALCSAWNQESALVFARDGRGRLEREEQGEHAVAVQYDSAGRRARLTSSLGARQLVECDARVGYKRISELAHRFQVRFECDLQGLSLERALPGGGRITWQRDALGRPCVIRLELAGAPLRELSYEWGPSGRLLRRTDSEQGTTEYRYDARGEVAWQCAAGGRYQLRMMDAAGNPYAREDRRDREYGAAGQLLVRSCPGGEVVNTFDAAGQLVARREPGGRVWRYEWSAAGRLRKVVRPDGAEVTFGYDALGRRIWKKFRGQTTRFVWDGARLLHEWVEGELEDAAPTGDRELDAMLRATPAQRGTRKSPVTWLYDPDEGRPIGRLTSRSTHAVWSDHVGALTVLVDEHGQLAWSAESSLHGELHLVHGERHACLLRGLGMYEDLETGLYCLGAEGRYYDPAAGTFICQGPLAAAPTVRPYALGYDLGIEWSDPGAALAVPTAAEARRDDVQCAQSALVLDPLAIADSLDLEAALAHGAATPSHALASDSHRAARVLTPSRELRSRWPAFAEPGWHAARALAHVPGVSASDWGPPRGQRRECVSYATAPRLDPRPRLRV